MRVALVAEPIDPAALLLEVSRPDCGGVALFLGKVRDHSEGRHDVTRLEYEAYPGLAENVMAEIAAEAEARFGVRALVAVHRTGTLGVGDIAVAVAAASPHREQALEGARYTIDEIKVRVPIWKKEVWAGGEEWVRCDHAPASPSV